MPAGAQARSSTSLRLFSTWFSTSSLLPLYFPLLGPRLPLYFSLLAPRLFLDLSHLFSSLALVVLKFLSRKLTTFRSFPEGSCEVVVAPLRKS